MHDTNRTPGGCHGEATLLGIREQLKDSCSGISIREPHMAIHSAADGPDINGEGARAPRTKLLADLGPELRGVVSPAASHDAFSDAEWRMWISDAA